MDLIKRLEIIKNHFDNISQEEFEENLKKAGDGWIEPASKSGYRML